MASIVVRGLDEDVKRQLAERARANHRSMEAEVRTILTEATKTSLPNIGVALHVATQPSGGYDELPIPARSDIAEVPDFG